MSGLDRINGVTDDELTATLLACCDAPSWADAIRRGRPYPSAESLVVVADAAAHRLSPAEVDRALRAHPRIGQRAEGPGIGAAWSRGEQAGVSDDATLRQALLDGNRAYEERFGRVFLICASGLDGEQILAALRERLDHDDETEATVVRDELRKIALLRLRKVIDA